MASSCYRFAGACAGLTHPNLNCVNFCLQGNISEWKVDEGQEVAAGDLLAEIETDKATMDWESQVRSYLLGPVQHV